MILSIMKKDGVNTFHAESRAIWREWLTQHHRLEKRVWLIIYKKSSQTPSVRYDEAVDEALCFGWIDSKPNVRDDESYYQFFAKRNPKSNWSKVNKEKIKKLEQAGLISDAGYEMIDLAKENGTWNALDDVEKLILPEDLRQAFSQQPSAKKNFAQFPKSVKRGILEWILNAKRPETRAKRIQETVAKAAQNIRANQFRK